MSYYTDKVYSSNFLSKSRGLDEMLVQDTVEERPPLPESRQSRLEARLKETTARDTSFTRTKREPLETVLYLGPSRGAASNMELRDSRELRERKRKEEESAAMITSRSNRSLLEESRRSSSYLNHGSQTSYNSKARDAEQNPERDHRPMSMSRTTLSSGQRFGFKDESPSRPKSALSAYSIYNTRRSQAPEVVERRREENTPLSYSSSRVGRRGEERDWLPSSSSSRLLVRGDQQSGVEIFSHTAGGFSCVDKYKVKPKVTEPADIYVCKCLDVHQSTNPTIAHQKRSQLSTTQTGGQL